MSDLNFIILSIFVLIILLVLIFSSKFFWKLFLISLSIAIIMFISNLFPYFIALDINLSISIFLYLWLLTLVWYVYSLLLYQHKIDFNALYKKSKNKPNHLFILRENYNLWNSPKYNNIIILIFIFSSLYCWYHLYFDIEIYIPYDHVDTWVDECIWLYKYSYKVLWLILALLKRVIVATLYANYKLFIIHITLLTIARVYYYHNYIRNKKK